jgi:hypothetical protein
MQETQTTSEMVLSHPAREFLAKLTDPDNDPSISRDQHPIDLPISADTPLKPHHISPQVAQQLLAAHFEDLGLDTGLPPHYLRVLERSRHDIFPQDSSPDNNEISNRTETLIRLTPDGPRPNSLFVLSEVGPDGDKVFDTHFGRGESTITSVIWLKNSGYEPRAGHLFPAGD